MFFIFQNQINLNFKIMRKKIINFNLILFYLIFFFLASIKLYKL
jgi:hypothetical protein